MDTHFLPPSSTPVKPSTTLKTMPERSLRLLFADKMYDASRNSMPIYNKRHRYPGKFNWDETYAMTYVLDKVRFELGFALPDVSECMLVEFLCNGTIL